MKKRGVTKKKSKPKTKKDKKTSERREFGRPSVFLEERVRNTIIAALKMGLSREDACYLAGVSPSTFSKFVNRLEESQTDTKSVTKELLDFFIDIKKARSELKVRMLRKIDEAAEKNWQAAAWRLERGFPDEFGRKFNEAKVTVDKNSDQVIVEIKIPEELKLD